MTKEIKLNNIIRKSIRKIVKESITPKFKYSSPSDRVQPECWEYLFKKYGKNIKDRIIDEKGTTFNYKPKYSELLDWVLENGMKLWGSTTATELTDEIDSWATFWIDPAGGIHSGNEPDPAAMYESISTPELDPMIKAFLKKMSVVKSNVTVDQIKVEATPKGNWQVYIDGENSGVIGGKYLDDKTIMKYGLERHDINERTNFKLHDLEKGKEYMWTGGAEPLKIKYIGIRAYNPDIKVGSSVGKGFIFQWVDNGKYLELGKQTIESDVDHIGIDEQATTSERDKFIETLQKKYPDAWFKPSGNNQIKTGEGAQIDEYPLFDYYTQDWKAAPSIPNRPSKAMDYKELWEGKEITTIDDITATLASDSRKNIKIPKGSKVKVLVKRMPNEPKITQLDYNGEKVNVNAGPFIQQYLTLKEENIEEATVPDNIKKFAQRKGVTNVVNQVARWAEKADAGTLIIYKD